MSLTDLIYTEHAPKVPLSPICSREVRLYASPWPGSTRAVGYWPWVSFERRRLKHAFDAMRQHIATLQTDGRVGNAAVGLTAVAVGEGWRVSATCACLEPLYEDQAELPIDDWPYEEFGDV